VCTMNLFYGLPAAPPCLPLVVLNCSWLMQCKLHPRSTSTTTLFKMTCKYYFFDSIKAVLPAPVLHVQQCRGCQ
jgi:hypothetical protein